MSQSTTAAVRQNEMNVNVTLLTMMICAARTDARIDCGLGASTDVDKGSREFAGPAFCVSKRGIGPFNTAESCLVLPSSTDARSSRCTMQCTCLPDASA